MTHRVTGFTSKPLFWGTALLSSAAAAGLAVVAANPEAVVTQSFTAALETGGDGEGEHAKERARPLIAGSEEFWLAQKRKPDGDGSKLEPAAWGDAPSLSLAVGDRVSVSKGGVTRVLEVVSVSEVPKQTAAAPNGQRQLLVTCRDVSSGGLVTFMTGGAPSAQLKRPQAL